MNGLFLGSLGDANNKGALKSSNVTHILTVANLSLPLYPNEFAHKTIKVMDREDTNLMQYFNECFSFIDEAKRLGGGVLVHCFMGISRRRPQASPNSGFILQLQQFEKTLRGKEYEKTRLDRSALVCLSIFSFFNKKQ
ncbi:dual specificity protein phosphatase 1B-like isoform X1 [Gossypium australe]|uniref:protein-tyrosine-phosphatase n=1 Tax=Gossypium australe TaxID=47621 RepID=A0A5B6UD42_9ROSI|nr:dual specificity protein phosphatase 1B-like isoform X1 [Gossypium australe]